jgi:hypothetical protein
MMMIAIVKIVIFVGIIGVAHCQKNPTLSVREKDTCRVTLRVRTEIWSMRKAGRVVGGMKIVHLDWRWKWPLL